MLACVAALGFTACDNDDYDTNQYKGGVSLSAFGPSPVMRGGTLRFYGSNLDQVKEVVIPGVSPITQIDVRQAGTPSEIHVQVPVDGPEVGLVTLRTANGTEITTLTELTYEEPIVVEGFARIPVVRRIDIQPAVKHIGRGVCHVITREKIPCFVHNR